jgi:hypothetical protein
MKLLQSGVPKLHKKHFTPNISSLTKAFAPLRKYIIKPKLFLPSKALAILPHYIQVCSS